MNKKIVVLMGGATGERNVSLRGARAVIAALKSLKYNVVPIDTGVITGAELAKKIIREKPSIAFILLHGPIGEDGTIQGFLEILGVLYTGSGVLASAIGMDKEFTKVVLKHNGILTPEHQVVYRKDMDNGLDMKLTYPVIVKPSSQGSTLGMTIVPTKADLVPALKLAFKHGDKILVEEYINGRELTVGVLEMNGTPKALPVIEIVPKGKFYDYKAKYVKGGSEHIIPAKISKELEMRVKGIALNVYNVIGCNDVARVDIILTKDEKLYVLEINTIPGFTNLSLVPEAAKYIGISFKSLVEGIVDNCLRRNK